jgi:farnesyl diphosphate synthase
MLDYNVPLGKLNRGLGVVDVVVAMNGGAALTADQRFKASVLGWCIEFVSCRACLRWRAGAVNEAGGGTEDCVAARRQQGVERRVPHATGSVGFAAAGCPPARLLTYPPPPPPPPPPRPPPSLPQLQAYFLVADDIMDNSVTRRGQPCWYRVPRVGLVAINDGIILEACIYRLLKRHFGGQPAYVHLLDLFHDVTYQTAHGQLLDTTTAPIGTVDLARYTPATYDRIVTYKTAFYTFYLPVACGLRLAGATDPAAYALAEDICVRMGRYFQIQDDVLDAFGDPAVIGKVGTDIEDNKCSWLVVQALERADAAQHAVIEAHYGKADHASVAAVKAVYRELALEGAFEAYEAESHAALMGLIEGQELLPKKVFLPLLANIYKRKK